MTSATQNSPENNSPEDLDVEPAIVLTNPTLKMLDAQFPDSEQLGMPDDALDGDIEQK